MHARDLLTILYSVHVQLFGQRLWQQVRSLGQLHPPATPDTEWRRLDTEMKLGQPCSEFQGTENKGGVDISKLIF